MTNGSQDDLRLIQIQDLLKHRGGGAALSAAAVAEEGDVFGEKLGPPGTGGPRARGSRRPTRRRMVRTRCQVLPHRREGGHHHLGRLGDVEHRHPGLSFG